MGGRGVSGGGGHSASTPASLPTPAPPAAQPQGVIPPNTHPPTHSPSPSRCPVARPTPQPELQKILRSKPGQRIMIFCTTKRMCDQLSYNIAREFRSAAIHGDKRQQERDYVLNSFKTVSVDGRRGCVLRCHVRKCGGGGGGPVLCCLQSADAQ